MDKNKNNDINLFSLFAFLSSIFNFAIKIAIILHLW